MTTGNHHPTDHSSRNRLGMICSKPKSFDRGIFVLVATVILLNVTGSLGAATMWVGNSAQCTGPNVHSSLNAALLAAAFSSEDDEIRLTGTVTYTGNIPALVDWDPATTGALTLAGGYSNCFASQAGRTPFGSTAGNTFVVETSSRPSSEVTLKSLDISAAGGRALVATDGADVALVNTRIRSNQSGIEVSGGASVSIDDSSIIEDNTTEVSNGGGIKCSGSGTYVGIGGRLSRNRGTYGGNVYIGAGCVVELFPGAIIEGFGTFFFDQVATHGGGFYVDAGGILVSNGGSNQVHIMKHHADSGGGIYVRDTGVAILFNTLLRDNSARIEGGAIHARDGGSSSVQLYMDRVESCPFLISCSEIDQSRLNVGLDGEAIFVSNSLVEIRRTILDENGAPPNPSFPRSLISAKNNATILIDGLGIARNRIERLFHATDGSRIEAAHVTATLNYYETDSGSAEPWSAVLESGATADVRNSIFNETRGFHTSGGATVAGTCNLVDTGNGLPPGSFFVGIAQFNSAATGDIRQRPESPGVDMCSANTFDHTGSSDIEMQSRAVDEATNLNGYPGEINEIYDAGFDEVHANIATEIFSDGFESGGHSAWSSSVP